MKDFIVTIKNEREKASESKYNQKNPHLFCITGLENTKVTWRVWYKKLMSELHASQYLTSQIFICKKFC